MTVAARSSAVEMKTKRDADDCISHLETMEIATKDPRSDNTINYAMRTKRLLRRVDVRLLPICAWMYLLNYLDRGNIGNARVLNQETGNSLIQETGITPSQYAWVVTLFSIAYCLFEVPSNWIMKKYVHPSHWLGILLVAWGACTMAFAAVHNFTTTAIVRVLIGVFEAGFFPGIVFLITFWYRPEERSIRIALIVSSATLAGAFGGCIAYGVGHMNGIGGIAGFRWLSILEGALTIVSVIPMLLVLPNHPTTVKWLSNDEKGFAITRVAETMNPEVSSAKSKRAVLQETLEPRMICHYLAYLTNSIPLGSLTFFSPTIVAGLGYTSVEAQIMTVPPWVVGYVISLLVAWSADYRNDRGLHVAAATVVGGVGWLTTGLLPADAFKARYGCMMLCACGAFPSAAPLSGWVTSNSPSAAAMAFVIALNNSVGGLSQLVCQWIFLPRESSRGYPTANFICAGCSFLTALITLFLRTYYARSNKKKTMQGGVNSARVWYL